MKHLKTDKILLVFVLASLLLPVLPSVTVAQNGTAIKVEPETVTKGPEDAVGEQFTIDITMYDVTNLYGWEVQLFWDNSLLNCTAEEYPILPEGLGWESPNSLLLGPGIEQGFNETRGRWYHGLSALPMSPPFPEPFTGDIRLVTLTFEVISQPAGVNVTSALKLAETKVSDPDAIAIDHEVVSGVYESLTPGLPSVPKPRIKIDPESVNAFVDFKFTVEVSISNVEATAQLVGVEFKVGFCGDKLIGFRATEGTFMNNPAWAPDGTVFISNVSGYNEDDWVVTGSVILPEWTAFPEGGGTLATITFQGKAAGTCELTLYDTKLSDPDANPIEHIVDDGVDVTVIEGAVSPDVNGDGDVDIFDIVAAALAFGSYPGHPRFNPVADQNMDGIIDIFDLVTIALATEFGPALPRPELKIEPESLTVSPGSNFNVEVSISNVETSVRLVGIEFKVSFCDDILTGFPATEGTFMNNPAWAPDGTVFISNVSGYNEDDWVITGTLILPTWTAFPEGGGTLATITFQATAEGSCELTLYDIKLSNPNADPIKYIADDNTVSVTVS